MLDILILAFLLSYFYVRLLIYWGWFYFSIGYFNLQPNRYRLWRALFWCMFSLSIAALVYVISLFFAMLLSTFTFLNYFYTSFGKLVVMIMVLPFLRWLNWSITELLMDRKNSREIKKHFFLGRNRRSIKWRVTSVLVCFIADIICLALYYIHPGVLAF